MNEKYKAISFACKKCFHLMQLGKLITFLREKKKRKKLHTGWKRGNLKYPLIFFKKLGDTNELKHENMDPLPSSPLKIISKKA
jgi:hypothetical protein